MRPADLQQPAAYRAERVLLQGTPERWDVEKLDLFATDVADCFGQVAPTVEVRHLLSRGRGGLLDGVPFVSIPRATHRATVLHELAHAWVEFEAPKTFAWHSSEWARVYLLLVDRVLGPRYCTTLSDSFDRHGVAWRPST